MHRHSDTVGEMFLAGYAGFDPAAADDLIRRHHVGGIILFTRNVRNADHAAEVCAELQRFRREVSDSPLFIAIDQEGGCVARITEGVTVFPGNMAIGASGSERYARQAAEITAAELASLGINVNFAPVLDIGSNPKNPGVGARAFGSEPSIVANLGSAVIEGLQSGGVLAAAKHFPGLGEALVDSHDELPVVNAASADLEGREFVPFRAAMKAGASFVMTAHCAYPSLDASRLPATLSEPILSGILRKQLGFDGIIITDCLEMLSIEKEFPAPKASLAAARAGATMLLICHTRDKQITAIDALSQAVENGDIPKETIERAQASIASAKSRLQFPAGTSTRFSPHNSLSESIALEAVTVVKNEGSLLPLTADNLEDLAVIVPTFDALTKVEESAEPHRTLMSELEQRHPRLQYVRVPVDPSQTETDECLQTCRKTDLLLILTYNMHIYPSQAKLVEVLLDLGKRTVVAAVRDPFDLMLAQNAHALIATYGFRGCSLKALVKILFGEAEARGRLPVDLGLPKS